MDTTLTRPLRIVRLHHVRDALALGTTSTYARIADGRITPPIRLTQRSIGWPEHEIEAIVGAMIAGATDDELRALVRDLVAARQDLAPRMPARGIAAQQSAAG